MTKEEQQKIVEHLESAISYIKWDCTRTKTPFCFEEAEKAMMKAKLEVVKP